MGVLPPLFIANFDVPFQYSMLPFLMLYFLFALFGWLKVPKVMALFLGLWAAIIVEATFSSIFGPLIRLGQFIFPTDLVQYVSRFLAFSTFVVIYYTHEIKAKTFLYVYLVVLLLAMLVGLMQFLPWSGAPIITSLYTYKEKFVQGAAVDLVMKRVSGIAGMPTANGGLAAFAFVVALSILLFLRKYRLLCVATILLAVLNTLASQARMGYVTIAFSFLVFVVVWIKVKGEILKPVLALSAVSITALGVVLYMFSRGNRFIVQAATRWLLLGDQVNEGGNRVGQIEYVFNHLLKDSYDYVFGISRGVQQSYGLFMEVEPVNILLLYGAAGFVLQYLLIAVLLVYFWRRIKLVLDDPPLLTMMVASFTSLLCYQFFSVAYYFFREIHIPLFPWLLMGACSGAVERYIYIRRNGTRVHEATATTNGPSIP
jgi:hypothetical protein